MSNCKWNNKKYALEQLDSYIKTNGTLKGMTVADKEGIRINTGLRTHGYDIEKLVDELGYDYRQLKGLYYPKNYLKSYDNFKNTLTDFVNENGFFPTLNIMKNDLHIPQSVIYNHGSINKIRKDVMGDNSNLLEDDSGFCNRSYYEFMVAQFLLHNNVTYLREQNPFPKPFHHYRSDFTFFDDNDTPYHIEVWGYYDTDNKSSRSFDYNKNKKKKLKLYKEYLIEVISITPDIFNGTITSTQNKLLKLLQPYLSLQLKVIDNCAMKNPLKMSDEEILSHIMQYTKDDKFLPRYETLEKKDQSVLTEIIKRYENYNNFAKAFDKLTQNKRGLWDADFINKIMNYSRNKYGFIPTRTQIKTKTPFKQDKMFKGFCDGIKHKFKCSVDCYLSYYEKCSNDRIILSPEDMKYVTKFYNGRGFKSEFLTEERLLIASKIIHIQDKLKSPNGVTDD